MANMKKIRSGDEIVNEFFSKTLNQLSGLDQKTKEVLTNLFNSGKLNADGIEQELAKLREDENK